MKVIFICCGMVLVLEQIKWFRESLKLEIGFRLMTKKEMRSFHHLWSSDRYKRVDGFFI